jgi:cysteine synthase A
LAGVSKYLKEKKQSTEIVLADPEGSGLFNKVKFGVLFTNQEKEGHRLKNPFDTVVEGVGLNRPTANLNEASIDDAFRVTDREVLHMSAYLIENEGLFVGGSSAMNAVCAVKQARKRPNSNIVTIAHDSGIRYIKKLFNEDYLRSRNISFTKKDKYAANDLSFV